jgi:DNA topoisomerase IB
MMQYVTIFGVEYGFCRSQKCSYKDKWNRAVKLAGMFEALSEKFDGIIERGSYSTDNARLALACKMMMYTGIRIGNEGSAEGYMTKPHPYSKEEPKFVKTYGLTTLLREHITFRRGRAYINFLGKKHVDNTFMVEGDLARQLKQMLASHNGNTAFGITDYELTKFIKRYVGRRFTPKDFRTMRANMYAYDMLAEILERENPHTKKEFNAEVKEIATYVSGMLNNTPGVCKKSYIDSYFWSELETLRPIIK